MSVFSQSQATAVAVGNDAGWALAFYNTDSDGTIADQPTAVFRSSDYYAEIDAGLQDGLQGGSYSITVQGLTDSDYRQISQAQKKGPIAAKLYLFWHDTISGPASYLRNMVGLSAGPSTTDIEEALVAVLFVTTVKRKLGPLSYDTEIHAVEWAFHMMTQRLQSPLKGDFYTSVCLDIRDRTQVPINTFPESGRLTSDAPGAPSNEKVSYRKGKAYGAILTEIASAVEKSLNKRGRNMLLIRDGQIYLGPRPFPLEGDSKVLTAATGLIEASADGSSDQDPTAPDLSGGKRRPHFTLTLKGRPDIKPGDVVRFDPAPEDNATAPGLGSTLVGAVMGPIVPGSGDSLSEGATVLAVSSVKHRLGKAAGFLTEVKGVELDDAADPWDSYSDKGAAAKPKPGSPTADAAATAASAITEHLEDWTANLSHFDIGQVRSVRSQTSGEMSPSQTETVWEGLQEIDENPNGTRRLPIDGNNAVRMDIPYATPFAWGKCGLVLPRYTGMRVALGHRRALDHDPVDLGAIWDSGAGPDSRPGDWWLSLPASEDAATTDQAADSDNPAPWSKEVSQDLIDANGNRMIELGSLVVRVGRDKLHMAGTRPELPDATGSISIEHVDGGSAIVMKQDGSILIRGTSIEIDAGSGNVTIKAKQVDIQ
jgi:hypothetical protein